MFAAVKAAITWAKTKDLVSVRSHCTVVIHYILSFMQTLMSAQPVFTSASSCAIIQLGRTLVRAVPASFPTKTVFRVTVENTSGIFFVT